MCSKIMGSFDKPAVQYFAFRKPIIHYIMNSAKGQILKKLHKTCKYLYSAYPFTILDSFQTYPYLYQIAIRKYLFACPETEKDFNFFSDKLVVINSLFLVRNPNSTRLISKIVKCEIKELLITSDKLTMEELIFLTKSGNILYIELNHKVYWSNKDSPVLPEDIFALVPKAKHINLHNQTFSDETLKNLIKMERQQKLKELRWDMIDQEINVQLLNLFLMKNIPYKSNVAICFQDEVYNEAFGAEIVAAIKTWPQKKRKIINFPKINVHSML